MNSNKAYPMAYGKQITISDDGINSLSELIAYNDKRVKVTSSLYCDLICSNVIDAGYYRVKVQHQNNRKTSIDTSSSYLTSGLVLGSLL